MTVRAGLILSASEGVGLNASFQHNLWRDEPGVNIASGGLPRHYCRRGTVWSCHIRADSILGAGPHPTVTRPEETSAERQIRLLSRLKGERRQVASKLRLNDDIRWLPYPSHAVFLSLFRLYGCHSRVYIFWLRKYI